MKVTSLILLLMIKIFAGNTIAESGAPRSDDSSVPEMGNPAPLTLIQNGRYMLEKYLTKGCLDSAEHFLGRMKRQIDTTNYNILHPFEEVVFDLLFGRFFYISNIVLLDSLTERYSRKAAAPDDGLARNMKLILVKNRYAVFRKMEKLDEMHFLFGNLFFDWIQSDNRDSAVQNRLNLESDEFLDKFPSGKYADYVRINIRYVIKPSDWGVGLSFFSGYGFAAGEIGKRIEGPVLIGHSFDFFYKKFGLVFYNQFGGIGKVKDSIYSSSDIWSKGAAVTHFVPAIHTGYLFVFPRLFLFPYVGIASHNVGISDTAKYGTAETPFHSSPLIGVTLDWRIARTRGIMFNADESGSWTIRTDLCLVNTRHGRYDNRFSGYLFLVKIGFGGIAWPIKREGLPKRNRHGF